MCCSFRAAERDKIPRFKCVKDERELDGLFCVVIKVGLVFCEATREGLIEKEFCLGGFLLEPPPHPQVRSPSPCDTRREVRPDGCTRTNPQPAVGGEVKGVGSAAETASLSQGRADVGAQPPLQLDVEPCESAQ